MTIEQLIKELTSPIYKSEKNKIDRLKRYLKTDYVDYEMKISICERILKASRYIKIGEKNVYKPNGPLEYELKVIALIQTYYKDIELRDGESRLVDFNLLEKNDLTKLVIAAIGDDIERFDAVYGLIANDMEYSESFIPWLDTKLTTLGILVDKGLDLLDNPILKDKVNGIMKFENVNN